MFSLHRSLNSTHLAQSLPGERLLVPTMESSLHRRKRPRFNVQDVPAEAAADEATRPATRRCYAQKPEHSDVHSHMRSPTLSPGPVESSSGRDNDKENKNSYEEGYRDRHHWSHHRSHHRWLHSYHFDRHCRECENIQDQPLSIGDVVELLDADELRNILVATAHEHPDVSSSLSRYFTLTRKQQLVPTFEDIPAKMQSQCPTGHERRRCLDETSCVTTQVGPNSSWAMKLNAFFALRLQGKNLQRYGGNGEALFAKDVREGMWKILELLSDEEQTMLFRLYAPLHVLMDFTVDVCHDRGCHPEPRTMSRMPVQPPWTGNPSHEIPSVPGAMVWHDRNRLSSGAVSADRLLQQAREDRDHGTRRCDDLCLEDPADHTNDCAFRLVYGYRPSTPEWHVILEEQEEHSDDSDDTSAV